MKTLKQVIKEAKENKTAVGHFNISNIEGLWAIFRAAQSVDAPVIIGLSEGEREHVGTRQAAALVKSLRAQYDYPIFINADHCHSFESVKEAVDAGFDAVIFDGATLPIEENIEITKKCVEYARSVNPEIIVEGELGYIGGSSKMLDEIPEGVSLDNLTTAEDAKRFVDETGVDLFSPSIGNIHGMLKSSANPELNIERIKEISDAVDAELVLHGGSGISDENFKSAIEAGISTVHINTEIRRAYREALEEALKNDPEQIAPYKFAKPAMEAMQEVVEKRIRLFSNL
ncbi:ketose-bisphosphate aldolase [Patescibacteria group bacterium]